MRHLTTDTDTERKHYLGLPEVFVIVPTQSEAYKEEKGTNQRDFNSFVTSFSQAQKRNVQHQSKTHISMARQTYSSNKSTHSDDAQAYIQQNLVTILIGCSGLAGINLLVRLFQSSDQRHWLTSHLLLLPGFYLGQSNGFSIFEVRKLCSIKTWAVRFNVGLSSQIILE